MKSYRQETQERIRLPEVLANNPGDGVAVGWRKRVIEEVAGYRRYAVLGNFFR